ncbi:PCNA_N domain-containing protein [Cephalotus follicularis]|uniref:PCNA_N domain-containing protein n=1 Tax=Cephalotus follicularis TaxID=3775 RepID=A0A1Q3CLB9_CEPFO|nr:PCNA_N domain-containing protein [Cephalotus follicularis]
MLLSHIIPLILFYLAISYITNFLNIKEQKQLYISRQRNLSVSLRSLCISPFTMAELWMNNGRGALLTTSLNHLMHMAEVAIIKFPNEGLTLIASGSAHLVIAVYHVPFRDFDLFYCYENKSASVNLKGLYQRLNLGGAYDAIAIYFDDFEDGIILGFVNPFTHQMTYGHVPVTEVYEDHVDINDINFEYEVVVGIPSDQFSYMMMQLAIVENEW